MEYIQCTKNVCFIAHFYWHIKEYSGIESVKNAFIATFRLWNIVSEIEMKTEQNYHINVDINNVNKFVVDLY